MTFIFEKIQDQDKAKFDVCGFRTFLTRDPIPATYWAIDRERDAFLVTLGGGTMEDVPHFAALVWQSNAINICANQIYRGSPATGVSVEWSNFSVDIPISLKEHEAEIRQMIEDGLTVYELSHNPNLNVHIDCR